MSDLKGHVAIVTGSTKGRLGQAMGYKALAGQGCNVVINGLGDPHTIETERCEIANAYGVDIKYHGADMTKPDQIPRIWSTSPSASSAGSTSCSTTPGCST